jgi:hypothetical protein
MKDAEARADERQGKQYGGIIKSQQQLMDENRAVQYGGQPQQMNVTDEINKSMLGYPVIR